jgi:hypothetical protein
MGRVVGNDCEHGENTPKSKKISNLSSSSSSSSSSSPSQRFSIGPSWVILSHLIGFMEFLFVKLSWLSPLWLAGNATTLPKESGVSIYSFTFTQCLNVLVVL